MSPFSTNRLITRESYFYQESNRIAGDVIIDKYLTWFTKHPDFVHETMLIYSYFETGCPKNVQATIPKGIYGVCSIHCCCFPLALADICPRPNLTTASISLKNGSEFKATHNTVRGCCVHFIRQPSSNQLYVNSYYQIMKVVD